MSASLNRSFLRGYFATFGLILGLWTQLAVVAVGLGAVIATSALAFAVVKWLGNCRLPHLPRHSPVAGATAARVANRRPLGAAGAAPAHRRRGVAAQRRQGEGDDVHARQ